MPRRPALTLAAVAALVVVAIGAALVTNLGLVSAQETDQVGQLDVPAVTTAERTTTPTATAGSPSEVTPAGTVTPGTTEWQRDRDHDGDGDRRPEHLDDDD